MKIPGLDGPAPRDPESSLPPTCCSLGCVWSSTIKLAGHGLSQDIHAGIVDDKFVQVGAARKYMPYLVVHALSSTLSSTFIEDGGCNVT